MEDYVPCVSNNVKTIIIHVCFHERLRKNMDNFDKKFLETEPGSIARIFSLKAIILSFCFVK